MIAAPPTVVATKLNVSPRTSRDGSLCVDTRASKSVLGTDLLGRPILGPRPLRLPQVARLEEGIVTFDDGIRYFFFLFGAGAPVEFHPRGVKSSLSLDSPFTNLTERPSPSQ